ncbi:MAG: anti-sigma factor, partial [Pseudomonadota bacterium]
LTNPENMIMNHLMKLALFGALCASLSACNDSSLIQNTSQKTLSISSTNLEALGNDYNYEGWVIVNGKAVSAGIFDIIDGKASPSSFQLDADSLDNASKYVLTIEPENDTDPSPASTHIIAGDINNSEATAVMQDSAALGTDFSAAAGTFILATPSNSNATPEQGIWFLDNSSGSPVASLSLPTLPAGWAYEGWVVGDNGPVSTGTFTRTDATDSDGAGPAAGPMGTPPFPGQDFINPAMDVSASKVVISVEPVPDNSPAPFSIKPLIADAGMFTLNNVARGNAPSATIMID